jgi:hypothetical protein
MRRFAALPALGLAFAVACEAVSTAPKRLGPDAAGPSFNGAPSDQPCVGTLPPGTYQNVFVPRGASCVLSNSTLTGNLEALEGSLSLITSDNRIAGNIQADKVVEGVRLLRDEVGGDVNIVEGRGSFYLVLGLTLSKGNINVIKSNNNIQIHLNRVLNGNIKAEDNTANLFFSVQANMVFDPVRRTGGNVQVFKNTGTGPKLILNNTARENVQCKENVPLLIGTPNFTIQGKVEDQCAPAPVQ